MNNITLIFCTLLSITAYTQRNPEANRLYLDGVHYFSNNNLRAADSLFSLSIDLEQNVDAYFNRAVVNKKLGNNEQYCINLDYARKLYDNEANELFFKECVSVDSIFVDEHNEIVSQNSYSFKLLTKSSLYSTYKLYYKYDTYNNILLSFEVENNDTSYTDLPEEVIKPTYEKIISQIKITYPSEEESKGIQGKVYLRFDVTKTGEIVNLEVVRTPSIGLAKSAIQTMKMITNLEPVVYKGGPIKVKFYLPINYKLK